MLQCLTTCVNSLKSFELFCYYVYMGQDRGMAYSKTIVVKRNSDVW